MKKVIMATASVLFLGLSTGALAETDDAKFQAAWETANLARLQAAELGHEWRDTKRMLEKAMALATEGDYEQAMQLVEHAEMESLRATEQAQQQATLWQEAVPK